MGVTNAVLVDTSHLIADLSAQDIAFLFLDSKSIIATQP